MASKTPAWLKILLAGIGIVVVLLVVGVVLFRHKLGTKYAVNDKESVYYAGNATEAEARELGKALTGIYFDGKRNRDVLLRKEDGKTIVSFVVQEGVWERAEVVEELKRIVRQAAPSIGGLPVLLRLVDEDLDVKKELTVP